MNNIATTCAQYEKGVATERVLKVAQNQFTHVAIVSSLFESGRVCVYVCLAIAPYHAFIVSKQKNTNDETVYSFLFLVAFHTQSVDKVFDTLESTSSLESHFN